MSEKTPEKAPVKSPLALRMLIWIGSALFCILLIWFLGFLVRDIGGLRRDPIAENIAKIDRDIQAAEDRQTFLKESVNASRQVTDQMLKAQKANTDNSIPATPEQQTALGEAQKRFLDNQQQYQAQIEKVLSLKDDRRKQQEALDSAEHHDLVAASLKILLLLPALLLAVWLFLKKRSGAFAPLVYAVGVAVLWQLIDIIHEHFPTRYYKYIFIVAAILVVLKILVVLIRSSIHPSRALLRRRYREAYRTGRCPVCDYPILRGVAPLAQAAQAVGGKKMIVVGGSGDEGPYTCPSCGERLFEECPACHKARHTLLSNCQHCGATTEAKENEPLPA